MKKNQPWKDWGIKEHWNIPKKLLDAMAATPGFDINYVREAAARHADRYILAVRNEDSPDAMPRSAIESLISSFRVEAVPRMIEKSMDKAGCVKFFQLGQILEYCMVADALEEFIQDQTIGNPDGEQS